MVTYRGFVKNDDFRTRHMLAPMCKLERPRDSKALCKAAVGEFVRLLERNAPAGPDAKAWLEFSDRFGPTTLVEYLRGPDGRWRLEIDARVAEGTFPDFVP